MPRPTKKSELLNVPLDVLSGKLSKLEQFNQPITRMRIEQAIKRHPDLRDLLIPILDELDEHGRSVTVAKAAVSTVKSLLKKS